MLKSILILLVSMPMFSLAIFGGQPTDLITHPWQLRIKGCGAVLISSRHVLTAAHCVAPLTKKEQRPMGGGDGNYQDLVFLPEVAKVYYHEDYRGWKGVISAIKKADIAVIELKEDVEYTKTLRPVSLPSHTFDIGKMINKDPSTVSISGWGAFDINSDNLVQLKEGNHLNVLPEASDSFWINNFSLLSLDNQKYSFSETFKTGHYLVVKASTSQPCSGDSGGPMVEMSSETLIGLSAHTSNKCGKARYFFYTNVMYFMPWIQKVIEKTTTED